jgi:hypothetical protein
VIKASHLREKVIRPTLQIEQVTIVPASRSLGSIAVKTNLWSPAAEELLMMTAAQESKLGYYLVQLGDGPGLSIYSIEPATFYWLRAKFPEVIGPTRLPVEMVTDLRLATVVARLRYFVDSEPLPAADDIEGLARYYKRVFNTEAGSATIAEVLKNYHELVVGK